MDIQLKNKESFEFAQLLLKNYKSGIEKNNVDLDKHKKQLQEQAEDEEFKNNTKEDNKVKYSLDYSKFQGQKSEEQKQKENLEEAYENNPYLKQFQCSHDRSKERDLYEKSTKEKLENAEFFKLEGNKFMKSKDYDKASYNYQKALVYFDYTFTDTEEEEAKYNLLREQVYQNMALCKYQQNDFDECMNNTRSALKINKNNIKCLFKRGQIYFKRDLFKECQDCINQILEIENDNAQTVQLQKLLKSKMETYEQNKKKVCGKMFK